jgi:hypothetical protein
MALWLLVLSSLTLFFWGWASRYKMGNGGLAGVGVARTTGCPGTSADVQLTSVLLLEPVVLLEFQAAAATLYATGRPPARIGHGRQSLVASLDGDEAASIAMMRGWVDSGVGVVMWRDSSAGLVELSRLRTGQRVVLSVVPDAVTMNRALMT